MQLTTKNVLFFYDKPQVFVGVDAVDTSFVCSLVSDEDSKYLCVPVSNKKIQQLCSSKVDLKTIYSEPEKDEFYEAVLNSEKKYSLIKANYVHCPDDYLPESGLYFSNDYELTTEGDSLNKTVSYISLSVPSSNEFPRIKAGLLSEFISCYQSSIKNLARKYSSEISTPKRTKVGDNQYDVDVFDFAYGSFKIKMMPSSSDDISGDNPYFIAALEKIDKFLTLADNLNELSTYMQSIKGRASASLIKLIDFLALNSIPINQKWYSPSIGSIKSVSANIKQINDLSIELKKTEVSSSEEITVNGRFDGAYVSSNKWAFLDEDNKVIIRGLIGDESEVSLNGVVIGEKR